MNMLCTTFGTSNQSKWIVSRYLTNSICLYFFSGPPVNQSDIQRAMQEVYQQELSRLQLAAALGRAGQATSNGDPASAPTAAPGAASPKSAAAAAGAEGEGEKDSSTITATPSDKESAEKESPPIPEHLGNFWEFSREPV